MYSEKDFIDGDIVTWNGVNGPIKGLVAEENGRKAVLIDPDGEMPLKHLLSGKTLKKIGFVKRKK